VIEVLLIVVSLALVAACGAFVAAEFAFVTVDRSAVDRAAEDGDRRARGLQAALRSLSTQLSSAQLGITVTNLAIGFMAEPTIARLIDGPLESAGVPGGAVRGVSVTVALVLATGFTMVFGELVPKNLALSRPLATARAVQAFHRGFTTSMRFAVRLLNNAANAILLRLGIEPQEELASARSADELSSLVRRSADEGTLEEGTATLLERSLAFGEQRAPDVMTPWSQVHRLRVDDPVVSVLETARETGHSRFPVVESDSEDVAGIVHVKQAMSIPYERRRSVPVSAAMVPPLLVPTALELDPLLDQLRGGGLQMAVVVDEWGNVDGIVTLEDLIEEIVGEVHDEYDHRDGRIRREGQVTWSITGLLRPDEVAEHVGLVLPEDDDYETLGGLMADRLERIPAVGDRVEIEAVDDQRGERVAVLTVLAMDGLRVDRIRLEDRPRGGESDDSAGDDGEDSEMPGTGRE
jgi:CBS domain containing-hemolysin-like protein